MGSHWNKEHTALARLCKWPHISIVLIFWVTHWYVDTGDPRPGYKLNFFPGNDTSHRLHCLNTLIPHNWGLYLPPQKLWFVMVLTRGGVVEGKFGHSACLVYSYVTLMPFLGSYWCSERNGKWNKVWGEQVIVTHVDSAVALFLSPPLPSPFPFRAVPGVFYLHYCSYKLLPGLTKT